MVFWRFVNGKCRANSMWKIFGNRNEIKEDIFGRFFTCFGFETERERGSEIWCTYADRYSLRLNLSYVSWYFVGILYIFFFFSFQWILIFESLLGFTFVFSYFSAINDEYIDLKSSNSHLKKNIITILFFLFFCEINSRYRFFIFWLIRLKKDQLVLVVLLFSIFF